MLNNWMVKENIQEAYLTACRDAVSNITSFKQDPRLTAIFEHCPKHIADEYYNQLPEEFIKHGFTNDFYGKPTMHSYGQRRFSTSTLQYMGVLSNLVKYFGSLEGLRIVEIGGGYGGQCRTIYDMFTPELYHIIDLPDVCELQRKYCKAMCFDAPTGLEYDLVISNYALSEIPDNKHLIERVVKRSKHGYITCNTDYVKLDFLHFTYPDIAGERETNKILVW